MCLQELFDAAQAGLKGKRYYRITSVDFGGAFDKAAHSQPLKTLMGPYPLFSGKICVHMVDDSTFSAQAAVIQSTV